MQATSTLLSLLLADLCFAGMVKAQGLPLKFTTVLSIANSTNALQPALNMLPTAGRFVDMEDALLEVNLNGQNLRETVMVLVQPDGRVLVRVQDLVRWRLRMPDTHVQTYGNEPYILLDTLSSVSYRVDSATQSLQINVHPENLQLSVTNAQTSTIATPRMPSAGGFLNYDFTTQHSQGVSVTGAQFELGMFTGGGVFTTQIVNRDIGKAGGFVRLESTLTMDHPEQRASLRVGDAISRGGAWGRPVRFGGLQWSTNFATQPSFITFPLPTLSGSAALPSTAEVFVNSARTYQQDIQAGPFSIRDLPVVTGQGEVRMVVRDLLGREQVIVQPFYAARSLLKPGLDDFSYEFGAVRENFGVASNDYGKWLFAGTRRHGFSEQVTGEVHGELSPGHQSLGFAATTLFPDIGVVDIAVAGSHGKKGNGGLLTLGFDRQTPRWSFGLRTQITSKYFDQLGLAPDTPAPLRQTTAYIGWNEAHIGSLGLGYARLENRDQPASEVISANFSRNLARDWFLGVSAFKSLRNSPDYAIALMLTHVLGERTSASLSANRRNGPDSAMVQVQQNLPAGTGMGYRILADSEGKGHFDGTLSMQNDYGTYALQAARFNNVSSYRSAISGGMAVLGGHTFLARRLSESFAVVQASNFPNVQVYAENQPVTRTNASGLAFVPRLRPYQQNHLRIEQADLPLDARIDALEVTAVPYFRSGYLVEFPVGRAQGAQLRIVTTHGQPIPAGAQLSVVGQEGTYPIANDGQTYVTGLKRNNQIKVLFPDRRVCEFDVPYPQSDDPLPDLGNFVCKDTQP